MDMGFETVSESNRVRAVVEDLAEACRAKDLDRILAHHAADIVGFDCHSQLQMVGIESFRSHLHACLSCMQGPMIFDIYDLDITASETVAFARYLARCGGTGPDGAEHVVWLRATVCLRRTNGAWTIAHAHCSAPFDPETGRAMLDLRPPLIGGTEAGPEAAAGRRTSA